MSISNPTNFYEDFARNLRRPDANAIPTDILGGNGERFKIYRNNVFKGYQDALAAAYPVVARLVGEAFFDAMAREFYLANPQPHRSLALYGDGFAQFIRDFPPATSLPYLADVAALERAWLEAYHAADADPIDPNRMSVLEGAVENARLTIHPATRLVHSAYPVYDIWQANRGEASPTGLQINSTAQTVLVTRPQWDVHLHNLTPETALITATLMEGRTIGAAYEATLQADPEFDFALGFAKLLSFGIFTDIQEGI